MTSTPLRIASAGSTVFGARAFIDSPACRRSGFGPDNVSIHTDHGHLLYEHALSGSLEADIVMLPSDMIDALDSHGVVAHVPGVALGSVPIGAAVRTHDTPVRMDTMQMFGDALLAADKIILTLAPSGEHMMNVIAQAGLMDRVATEIKRFDKSAQVNACLTQERDHCIAFGPATEILAWREKGIDWCGKIPETFQLSLPYAVAILMRASNAGKAQQFLPLLTSQEARDCFSHSGVEYSGG